MFSEHTVTSVNEGKVNAIGESMKLQSRSLKSWSKRMLGTSVLLSFVHGALAYEPPIGIPDPGGINPKTGVSYGWEGLHPIDAVAPNRPSNWGNGEVSGFYYINPDHAEATDNGNEYGNPSKPRVTLPRVVPAGSYVEMAGNYGAGTMQVRYRCTLNAPCWIRGSAGNAKANITGDIDVLDSSYVFIENIDFDGGVGNAISIKGDTDHIVVRNTRIVNRAQPIGYLSKYGRDGYLNSSAIGIAPRAGAQPRKMSDIVIYNNEFDAVGAYDVTADDPYNLDGDPDFHAVVPSLWGAQGTDYELKNVWILENTCARISGDCVQVNSGNWTESWKYLHHVYIGKNVAKTARQVGFGVKQASDVVISQNKIFGQRTSSSGNGGGAIGFQYEKHNLWILFNEMYGTNFGIRQSDTGDKALIRDANGNVIERPDAFIMGNLIYDINPVRTPYDPGFIWGEGVGIAFWKTNLDRYIVDNTIYATKAGIHSNAGVSEHGDVNLSGNIIADIGPDQGNTFFRFGLNSRTHERSDGREIYTVDHGLFHDDSRQQYYSEQPGTRNMYSLEEVTSDSTYCQESCEFADPLFVNATIDPETRDFRLQAGSPAIGANIKHPAYDRFEELYGLNIYKDFNGNDRHPTNPSLGAFEYKDETDPFDPAKLQVKVKYPTKNPVYTHDGSVTAIQFGGHASYEDETITVDWVLAQCETDCVEELADGVGESQVVGSTQTSRVVDYPQNNWHVNSQTLFPGRNVLIVSAVHPNGEKKVTSLIIESELELVDELAPVLELSSPAMVGGEIVVSSRDPLSLSGNVSDNIGVSSMTWSCITGCSGEGEIEIDSGSAQTSWQHQVEGLRYGLNRIVLQADDAAGNATSLMVSIQVNDTVAPNLQIQQAMVSLTGSVSDNRSTQSVSWSCSSGCVGNGNAEVSGDSWLIERVVLGSGTNRIRVEAIDTSGNRSVEDFVLVQ